MVDSDNSVKMKMKRNIIDLLYSRNILKTPTRGFIEALKRGSFNEINIILSKAFNQEIFGNIDIEKSYPPEKKYIRFSSNLGGIASFPPSNKFVQVLGRFEDGNPLEISFYGDVESEQKGFKNYAQMYENLTGLKINFNRLDFINYSELGAEVCNNGYRKVPVALVS